MYLTGDNQVAQLTLNVTDSLSFACRATATAAKRVGSWLAAHFEVAAANATFS